jgi:hypothetical protein
MTTPAAATDSERGGRTYNINGLVVPSVTTVLQVVAKPALVASAVKITAETALKKNAQLTAIELESGLEAALKWLKGTYRKEWDAKRNTGSAVHAAIHQDILGIEAWPTAHEAFRVQWEMFKSEYQPTFEMAEATVFSTRPGHAGTLDTIAILNGPKVPPELVGKRGLFDVKTGSAPRDGGIWFEEMLQLATYRFSPEILMPDGTTQPMPDIDYAGVIHLSEKKHWVVEVPEANEDAYRVFLYLLGVYRFQKAHQGVIGKEWAV